MWYEHDWTRRNSFGASCLGRAALVYVHLLLPELDAISCCQRTLPPEDGKDRLGKPGFPGGVLVGSILGSTTCSICATMASEETQNRKAGPKRILGLRPFSGSFLALCVSLLTITESVRWGRPNPVLSHFVM